MTGPGLIVLTLCAVSAALLAVVCGVAVAQAFRWFTRRRPRRMRCHQYPVCRDAWHGEERRQPGRRQP